MRPGYRAVCSRNLLFVQCRRSRAVDNPLTGVHNAVPEALPDVSDADALTPPAPRLAGPDAAEDETQ